MINMCGTDLLALVDLCEKRKPVLAVKVLYVLKNQSKSKFIRFHFKQRALDIIMRKNITNFNSKINEKDLEWLEANI